MRLGVHKDVVGGSVELGQLLGSGGFGKVYYGYDKKRKMEVAVKVIEKHLVELHSLSPYVEREIEMMRKLKNPHVVQLIDVDESLSAYNIIMELAPNGELFDRIVNSARFDEATARLYFQQLISAVHYCHGLDIVHRDLKAENLLIGKNNELKVCDWGLSRYTREVALENDSLVRFRSLAGSLDYQAPEILSGRGYEGSACDMWSCGAILFFMLCGYLPFTDDTDMLTKRRIVNCEYNKTNRYLSPDASDLIAHLLEVNPELRYSTEKVIDHPWFQVDLDPELFPNVQHSNGTVVTNPTMPASVSQRVLSSSGCLDDTFSSSTVQLDEIHRAFISCNVNGSGFLNSEEVRDALIKLGGNKPVSVEEVKDFMSNFVLDDEGRISEAEFIVGWTKNQDVGKKYDITQMANLFHYDLEVEYLAEVRRAFDAIDVNGTGLITTESMAKLSPNCTKAEIVEFFNTVDPENAGRGTLSFEQFVHLCSRYNVFKDHPLVQRLRHLERIFAVTDIRWLQNYTGAGFTVAGSRENILLRIRTQEKTLSTKFEGNVGGFLYGTYMVEGKKILEVGIRLVPSVAGYTRVMPYRIAGKTRNFHTWFLQLRKTLREEIIRCEEDTVVKGAPELM
ncbi:Protein tyrosine kinase Protein kinase domain [Trypanosoma vivax]|uniref:non-specific serine/threonine protein kinase n=1 Tax=Trypanosoma vivax (strain Y486) TaxID=1055687 RepID=G0TRM6_TRYVY|nr:putative protein kinase [Trypanosoma vivax]KAH8606867.1 Protein tyrosine kinase Protein kinase domain [Trypanosoma vivax]CCC46596.1 putative protein kinase [Trypanosoma vivax Y486]